MKKLLILVMIGLGLWVSGCETTKGVGEDIENLGEEMEEETEEITD